MISFIQLLVVFSVVVQLIGSEPIPDDVIHKLIMNAVPDHDRAPLIGKCVRHQINAEDVVKKRVHIDDDHERAKMSILTDWVGAVPPFADKLFERTFRIRTPS